MGERTILHAGPPIEWADMSGPLRGAVLGAAVYEGLAGDLSEAERLAASGAFEFGPCHERGAVGPMAGVVSASMPMCVIENAAHGNRAFCTFNEGLGKVLRYGANDASVLDRLAWIRDVLARVFGRALREPIDLRAMIAQALQMGDEGHNRNRAGTSLLLRELMPALIELDEPAADVAAVARFMAGNDHFFLNLTMPASKAVADAAAGRGALLDRRRHGAQRDRVRRAAERDRRPLVHRPERHDRRALPAGLRARGRQPGHRRQHDHRDGRARRARDGRRAGDRARGRRQRRGRAGGHARGCTTSRGPRAAATRSLRWASAARRPGSTPARSCTRGVLPFVNTGIAHREPGVGQIGAGLVEPPMEAFVKAVRALAGL